MGGFDADVVILGGGCAGLSLAARLAGTGITAHVVEARAGYTNDRTWSFWADLHHEQADLVSARWPAWRFSAGGIEHVHRSADSLRYQMIAADDFYRWGLDAIEGSDTTTIELGVEVTDVTSDGGAVTVSTSASRLRARWVIDTRPPVFDPAGFAQVFAGAEIEYDDAVLDPTVAELMTDMTSDEHGFRFTYVLPLSTRRALVEETRFARGVGIEVLRAGLDQTLAHMARAARFRVTRRERGRIPMQVRRPPTPNGRIVAAGTAGGAVRPSTGYAFQRIQGWASRCAAALEAGLPPVSHAADPAWRSSADALFLRVIDRRPELAPSLFMALADGVEPATLVRFLGDEGRPRDFASVVAALPKTPFLAELPAAVVPLRR